MKRYTTYLILYSIGGFILERIINLIAFGYWLDNSVMVGPWQPLYGIGVVLTVLFYEYAFPRLTLRNHLKYLIFFFFAILSTAFAEAFIGYGYEWLQGSMLWDYNQTFTCTIPYVCAIPTTLFGILSGIVVLDIHPRIKRFIDSLPQAVYVPLFVIFGVDLLYTIIVLVV